MTSGGYVYCVGAATSPQGTTALATYYAQISSSGVGAWVATAGYLKSSGSPECVTSAAHIYCVAGSEAIFASISSSGIGAWTNTTGFPSITVSTPPGTSTGHAVASSCVTSGGYIYCLGAFTIDGQVPQVPVYYAALSSSGIGAWTKATSYPSSVQSLSCSTAGGYVYCVGGVAIPSPGETVLPTTSSTYYAPILPSGALGAWASTTSYPLIIADQSCAISGTYIYCVGGDASTGSGTPGNGERSAIYFAPIGTKGGLSAWVATTSYPIAVVAESCVPAGGYLYCIGGGSSTNPVYYSSVSSKSPPTSKLTVDTLGEQGNAITGYHADLYNSSGSLVATGLTPATFTVNTAQTYTVQVADDVPCQFFYWSTGNPAAFYTPTKGNSTTVSIAGDVSIAAAFEPVASAAASTPQPACGIITSEVFLSSINQASQAIFGYYNAVYGAGGKLVGAGYTNDFIPTTVGQTYSVQAAGYGSCTFTKWTDGVTSNPRSFTATINDLFLTAAYDCAPTPSTSTIGVSTVDSAGAAITGYYIGLWQGGAQVQSCFSPCSFTVNDGQTYQVLADSYGPETFQHWQNDGATGSETVNVPSASTTISLKGVYAPSTAIPV